jgi:hypothetical protein
MSEGYTNWEIHLFDPEEDEPEELPARVRYAPLLQEEDDFLDEDEELFSP